MKQDIKKSSVIEIRPLKTATIAFEYAFTITLMDGSTRLISGTGGSSATALRNGIKRRWRMIEKGYEDRYAR